MKKVPPKIPKRRKTIVISDQHDPNWRYCPPDSKAYMKTSHMGDCMALIIILNDGGRILAHLPAGDARQLNGGGLKKISTYILTGGGATTMKIVRGHQHKSYSSVATEQCYRTLSSPFSKATTVDGFWKVAQVDNNGNVTTMYENDT